MTPDREQDQQATLKTYRKRWHGRPDRGWLLDEAAAGRIIMQQVWHPRQAELDMIGLSSGRAPGLILIDDVEDLGPSAWTVARDCRAWCRLAIIGAGALDAEMLVEAAGQFGRVLAIETTRETMPAWSRYFAGKLVGLIAGDTGALINGTIH